MTERIDVIATTVSGSVSDWQKVKRIVPLFAEHGLDTVELHVAESHVQARKIAAKTLTDGSRLLISAGGSGTFNAVLEGCFDAGVPLAEIRLGFLRKGSADLIGKVLRMPDVIEPAIKVFADSIRERHTLPCDVLLVEDGSGQAVPRHFVGYGGAEIFGRIPHFTENRFMKWYKGVLSQVFGDLGPFTTGMTLALIEKLVRGICGRGSTWRVQIDGRQVTSGRYQALIIVNGYLGPDLPYSGDPLGSGRFQLFALRDQGVGRLLAQAKHMRDGSVLDDPARWGFEEFYINESLVLEPSGEGEFPVNVDGSTMLCSGMVTIRRTDRIALIAHLAGE